MKQINKSEIEKLAINANLFSIPKSISSDLVKQEIEHPQPVPYYRFFYHLSKLLKPELCLELGTNHGMAAACLALGNPGGKVITINNVQNVVFESCKLPNIDFWIQDSVAQPKYDLQNIDILFIDTSSKGARNKLEYDFWINRVKPGGIVLIDDIFIVKDHMGMIKTDFMAEFWRNFKPEGEKIELPLHAENGFGVVIKQKRRKKISHVELRDKHRDKDIYVLGSGMSMDYISKGFFKGKIVIGVNSIWKYFPTTYALFKHEQFIQAAIDDGRVVIVSKHDCGDINRHEIKNEKVDYIFTHKKGRFENLETNFQENLDAIGKDDDIFVSYSTITSGIHLAAYMGAKNIILCGHDCGYLDSKSHTKDSGKHLIDFYKTEIKFNEYYNMWFERANQDSIQLKKKLEETYGCNIYSLNPFINFRLEGHKYVTQK